MLTRMLCLQENVDWRELEDGSLRIEQNLIVPRANFIGILAGKGGVAMKTITKAAVADMVRTRVRLNRRRSRLHITHDQPPSLSCALAPQEKAFGRKVHLLLRVVHKKSKNSQSQFED
jgi:GTPase Era involved in 16S rRNA processing